MSLFVKEKLSIFLFIIASAAFGSAAFLFWNNPLPTEQEPPENHTEAEEPDTHIELFLVGDIMLDRGIEQQILNQGDWRWPFLEIEPYLREADILFGNLEGPLSDKGVNVGSIYSFRANPLAMEGLEHAGFDVLSLANNHSFDYGRFALEDTMRRVTAADMSYAGSGFSRTEAHSPAIIETKGTTIGFLAYTSLGSPNWQAREDQAGVAWLDASRLSVLREDVQRAAELTDILVVSIHAGNEYATEPTIFQQEAAQIAIEAGADVVAEHHAHVLQPMEQYKDGWIAYGLGNFVFDQDFSVETKTGGIMRVEIENKKVQHAELIKTRQNSTFQVELLEE